MPVRADWYRDAVIYELHVRAFADSNGDGTGDFDGLTSRLDYLVDLGVTALWLLPYYPSPLRDDGYDIADYRVVNPDFGTMRSFKRFLAAAHARGLKVITELVVNHTSDQHPWFQRARHAPKDSHWRNFYVWSDDPQRYADARIIFSDFETSNWAWDPVAEQYYWHRFYSHQPDLNYSHPPVEQAVFEVLDHWFDLGVDGLRLDAVPYLFEREGTNCENLPETHALLKRLRAHMDAKYEDRMLLAEANQWPEDASAYFGEGDECHMNFHFPLMPRMFMSVQMENRMPIIDILEQTPDPPGIGQWATFLRNHDELTLEMVTDEERDLMLRSYARESEMRINLGIRRRLAPLMGNDRRKIELLNALLFSLPGTPVLYYGDEIGMGDNVYLGDRDGVRTPMQWTADRNAGFSTCNPHRLYLPLIADQEYHYESVNVEAQQRTPTSLLSWMRQIIALRRRHRVLGRGAIEFLDPENPHVLAFVRTMDGEESFLCVANLSRLAQHVELDLRRFMSHVPVEIFGRNRFRMIGDTSYQLTLAPYGFFWFALAATDSAGEFDTPIPHLAGVWDEVLRRRAPLARAVGRWIPGRRWYAAKDKTVRETSVDEVIPLKAAGTDAALLVVRMSFTEGEDHRYAVPVLRSSRHVSASIEHALPSAVLARLDDGALLVDAMVLQEGAHAVASAALSRRQHRGRHAALRGAPRRSGLTRVAGAPPDVHLIGAEQSNSSAILGGQLIAKLVRRVDAARNPDVELPEHLSRRGFPHVPGLAATLELDLPGESASASVVIVHDAVPNDGDLWQWMLSELSIAIENRSSNGEVAHPEAPGSRTEGIARLVGQRIAELHAALAQAEGAGDAMRPQPFTLLWQRSLLQTVRTALRSTQRAIRRQLRKTEFSLDGDTTTSAATGALVDQLIRDGDAMLRRFERLRETKLDAKRIRVHGDLHLGQILWTGHDVVFIDFEGEPARPMGERRIKRSPLVDVAGLVRSIDYAGRSAVHTAVERGLVGEHDVEALDQWRRRWTESMTGELLDAYFAEIAPSRLVPSDPADAQLLLDLYIFEKGLYEVRYEIAHRPGWVAWPLSAVVDMIEPVAVT